MTSLDKTDFNKTINNESFLGNNYDELSTNLIFTEHYQLPKYSGHYLCLCLCKYTTEIEYHVVFYNGTYFDRNEDNFIILAYSELSDYSELECTNYINKTYNELLVNHTINKEKETNITKHLRILELEKELKKLKK